MKISVIWAWSRWLAISDVLAFNWNDVLIFARDKESTQEINQYHTSQKYLNWAKIYNTIKASSNLKEVLDFSNYLVLAIPSKSMISCLEEIKKTKNSEWYFFINVAKWINRGKTMQQIIKEHFPIHRGLTSILWPSFAKNVINKDITSVCSVSANSDDALFAQALFSNNYFRVYTQSDVIWSELCSSLKNAIAIASWIASWLWYWENTRAWLITRGLKEITILWDAMWARTETFFWLTWLWDLLLTCSSNESRNFQAWYQIWKDDWAKKFLETNQITVEWIATIEAIENMAKEKNLELPILHALYLIIYENAKPSEMLKAIMKRPLTREW